AKRAMCVTPEKEPGRLNNSTLLRDGKGLVRELEKLPSLRPAHSLNAGYVVVPRGAAASTPPPYDPGLTLSLAGAGAWRSQACDTVPSQNCGRHGLPRAFDRWTWGGKIHQPGCV